MADLLSGLLALDRLATGRGDGLKPALATLLRAQAPGAGGPSPSPAAPVIDLARLRAARRAAVADMGGRP
jgi:hypothetical protein